MANQKLSLKDFGKFQLVYLHKALKQFIEAGSGYGFHNHDMGHIVYQAGAAGEKPDAATWGDGPEQNDLYQLLKAIHEEMKSRELDEFIEYPFDSWQSFCKLAVKVHKQKFNERFGR